MTKSKFLGGSLSKQYPAMFERMVSFKKSRFLLDSLSFSGEPGGGAVSSSFKRIVGTEDVSTDEENDSSICHVLKSLVLII